MCNQPQDTMKKLLIRLLFAGLAAAMACSSASASYTRYDFSFETDNTITVSGYFTIDDTWVANGTYQAVTAFAGSLDPNSQTSIITGGAFTDLAVKSLDSLLFRFVSGGVTYTANFGGGANSETGYELSYKPSGATTTVTEIYNPNSTPSRPAPLTDVTPMSQVPEIDGDKFSQAALLVAGLFLAYRSRRALKWTASSMLQTA